MALCRVGLIGDHPLYADALERLISGAQDLHWAGSAESVDALLRAVPDVELAILDLRLADGSLPQENVERLHARGVAVLVYTSGALDTSTCIPCRSHSALNTLRRSVSRL